jgi:hypothetical protein
VRRGQPGDSYHGRRRPWAFFRQIGHGRARQLVDDGQHSVPASDAVSGCAGRARPWPVDRIAERRGVEHRSTIVSFEFAAELG